MVRLQALESKNLKLNSSFTSPTQIKSLPTKSNNGISGVNTRNTATNNNVKKNETSKSLTKQNSVVSSASRPNSSNTSSSQAKPYAHRKFSFNKENGTVKFYLRGRPINLTIPSSYLQTETNDFTFDSEAKLKAPDSSLKLDWVYGYRGKDCRSNLHLLASGELVYFVAAVAVIYNHHTDTQRHYLEHNDDIKAMAVHPDKSIVATGQLASHDKKEGRPHVRIWDSKTLQTLKIIGLNTNAPNPKYVEFINSICCLAFSKLAEGAYLAAVDEGNERVLSVWNWQQGQKLCSAKCYSDLVFGVEFHPLDKNVLVTCGKQHVAFWNFVPESQQLTKRMGIFERATTTEITNSYFPDSQDQQTDSASKIPLTIESLNSKPKFVLSISFNTKTGEVITGDSEGYVLFWNFKDGRITKWLKTPGTVFLAHVLEDQKLVTGGKDGQLIEWDLETAKAIGIKLDDHGGCRALATIYLEDNKKGFFLGKFR